MVSDETERLRLALRRLDQPVYAVLDGAQFADLPSRLARVVPSARSLFMDARSAAERAGPWFAPLPADPAGRDRILALVGDRPAAVFWACRADAQRLWRHQRTLNQARVETGAAGGSRTLLFRHWDPRVLADVAPTLDGAQYARLLGPADEVLFLDPQDWGGTGVKRLVRLPELPMPARGQLVFTAAQVAEIDANAQDRSQRKVATFLTRSSPELTRPMSEDALHRHVAMCRTSGEAFGIATERGHMKWAFLMLATQGRAAEMPQVTAHLRAGGQTPDRRVDELLRQMVSAARERDARAG